MDRTKKALIAIIIATIWYFGFVATKNELSFTGANIFVAIVMILYASLFIV